MDCLLLFTFQTNNHGNLWLWIFDPQCKWAVSWCWSVTTSNQSMVKDHRSDVINYWHCSRSKRGGKQGQKMAWFWKYFSNSLLQVLPHFSLYHFCRYFSFASIYIPSTSYSSSSNSIKKGISLILMYMLCLGIRIKVNMVWDLVYKKVTLCL